MQESSSVSAGMERIILSPQSHTEKQAPLILSVSLCLCVRKYFAFLRFCVKCVLVPLCLSVTCAVNAQSPHRPHVIVVLADALRFEDIQNPECAILKDMACRGSLGMMNCAVAGARSGMAANLTLSAGRQVAAESTDAFAFNDWEAVPGENGEARMAYMRRVGPLEPFASRTAPDPDRAVKHLGIAALTRRGLSSDRLGAILASQTPPVTTWVGGNADTYTPDRSAALLTVDTMGAGAGAVSLLRFDNSESFGLIDDPLAMIQEANEAAQHFDFVVVQTGDLGRLEASRPYLSDQQFHARRDAALRRLSILLNGMNASALASGADLMLICPRPIANPSRHGSWDRLTPFIAVGPDFGPGLVASPTTRRMGLVANIDFAPTVLRLFHVTQPIVMTGRPITTLAYPDDAAAAAERNGIVSRLDFISGLNEAAKTTILLPLGLCCFLIVAGALVVRRFSPQLSRWFAPGFVFIMNVPAAMLLAPILVPPTLLEYGLRIAAWAVALTVFSYLPAFIWRVSPIVTAMAITIAILTVDTLTGQTLQKDSLFCGYAVAGIRYYGIGNEYLGVLIAFAILAVFCRLEDFQKAPTPHRAGKRIAIGAGAAWSSLAFMCGWPGLGANAGSLTVTAAAFGIGLLIICGKKPTWLAAVLFTLFGLMMAFLFGSMDAAFNGAGSSHSGSAILAAENGRGVGYLAEIALRKVQLNLHYLMAPGFLAGLAAISVSLWIASSLTGKALQRVLERRVWLTNGLYAIGAAAAAALLFKDSGVVTVDFMAGSALVAVLYYVITDSPSSSSEGPSSMPVE